MNPNKAQLDDRQPSAKLRIVRDEDFAPGADFYRCPGCGEMVEGNKMDDVRVHHDHVRHPAPRAQWFEVARSDTESTSPASRNEANPALRVLPENTYEPPPATRSRRYGHG